MDGERLSGRCSAAGTEGSRLIRVQAKIVGGRVIATLNVGIIAGEFVLRRVEVNRNQIFFLRWLSPQNARASQFPEVSGSHLELQLGFFAHYGVYPV
jgi:hypothetical protein